MTSIASRRIKGGRGPSANRQPGEEYRDYFRTAVILSVVLHALIFGAFWLESGKRAEKKIQMFSVTVTTLPGPQGGGGHSREIVKNPVKEEKPVPKEETVKIEKKEVEKKPPEKNKKPLPSKPEVAKVQHQAPEGPGQGPVGGGSKTTKPNAIIGPVAFEGNFRDNGYSKMIQGVVDRNWDPPVAWGNKPKTAIISFVIDRSGNITDIKVETSSGVEIYDQKAELALEKIRRLPPPPAGQDALKVLYSFIPGKS